MFLALNLADRGSQRCASFSEGVAAGRSVKTILGKSGRRGHHLSILPRCAPIKGMRLLKSILVSCFSITDG
jgi:hypothetical protein